MNTKEMIRAAEKMEEDAKKLREAADIIDHSIRFDPSVYAGTRAEQLEEFIRKHGGAVTRKEIIENSGIPGGTVASLLGHKKRFFKDAHDNWYVKKSDNPTNNHHPQPNSSQEVATERVAS